jgi:hypothetical protein
MPKPDIYHGVGSGGSEQTARVMIEIESRGADRPDFIWWWGCQFHDGAALVRQRQSAGAREPACFRTTARCRKRSTGWSPTSCPTSLHDLLDAPNTAQRGRGLEDRFAGNVMIDSC